MKSSILKGLSSEREKQLRQEFVSCKLLRDQYISILEGKKKAAFDKMVSEEGLDKEGWERKQIALAAEIRKINEFISLLS